MGHLRKRDLEILLSDPPARASRRRGVRQVCHLISGCAECASRAFHSTAEEDAVYDACIDRAWQTVQVEEDLWREEREKRDQFLALVRSKGWDKLTSKERGSLPEGWAGVEVLLAVCFEARYRDPRQMLRLARQARSKAENLDPALYGGRRLADLKARVWAELGNALRVNEQFDKVRDALKRARLLLMEQGTGDLLIQAYIDQVEGSFWKDQRYLRDAEDLLASACRKYLRIGERHLAGRALVTRGLNRIIDGQPREAVALLRQALALLDAERDPQLIETAQHNLLFALADAGEYREASELLLRSGLRQKFADDPLNLLRLRWVEAKILAGHGRFAEAEKALSDVRASFRVRRLELVATIAGLDLAKVLFQQGKLDPLHRLVRELRVAAEAYRLQDSVSRALATLEVMCQVQKVTLAMVEAVQRFFQRLQHNPRFTWEPELILLQ
jgi:tetratricopeptide (TPR) repeat protein